MDYRKTIVKILKRHLNEDSKNGFQKRAYGIVIKQIESLDHPVADMNDLSTVKGIGAGIRKKIEQTFNNPPEQENTNVDKMIKEIEALQLVHGIGPKKAKELVQNHNIRTLEDLKNHTDLLNEKQLLGLKYVDDFEKRIPRAEMDKHADAFKAAASQLDITYDIAGSYRRGAKTSGDIDILVTFDTRVYDATTVMKTIVENLKEQKYIKDVFAQGDTKFNGVCRLPRHRTHRRIDIMITDPKQYPFALMYFTGSKDFNVKMRNVALAQNLSLNEYGFNKIGDKKKLVIPSIKSEKDIFDYLGMEYVPPTKRT
jgi:DNA polymerase beta